MKFDQGKYWSKRGDQYIKEFDRHTPETMNLFECQEKILNEVLAHCSTNDLKSVLEIGCGFGRITKIVLNQFESVEYWGVDISSGQIENAKKYLGPMANRISEFLVEDFRVYPFNRNFDLVIVSEVFLHFTPNEIEQVLAKAFSLSNKLIIHIDPLKSIKAKNFLKEKLRIASNIINGKPARWDWTHDFMNLHEWKQIKRVSVFPVSNGIQGIYVVEKGT